MLFFKENAQNAFAFGTVKVGSSRRLSLPKRIGAPNPLDEVIAESQPAVTCEIIVADSVLMAQRRPFGRDERRGDDEIVRPVSLVAETQELVDGVAKLAGMALADDFGD